jgi:flavin reductase (DIM6/NTAB) family NADH-FMN oxidoreductase RutF
MSLVRGLSRADPRQRTRVLRQKTKIPKDASPDNRMLRSVLSRFATGVTVVTVADDIPRGMTANAFASVSLDPPLVLVCVNRNASIHHAVMGCGSFAVSVLSARQEHIARYFADPSRPRGGAEFGTVQWWPSPRTGAPVINGTLAWLECNLTAAYDGGDHSIFLGSVLASDCGSAKDALLFFGGGFHRPQLAQPRDP